MMNADQNNNNLGFQPTGLQFQPASTPVAPTNDKVPNKSKFRLPKIKIPLVAQISGFLSLLLIGAGLLTANQLSQNSQDLSTQAATGSVSLNFEQPTGTLTVGQEKTFNIVAKSTPTDLQLSAAVIRVRTENSDLIEVTKLTPSGFMPTPIQLFQQELKSESVTQWSLVHGILPLKPFIGPNTITTVTVKAKDKAGTAKLEIASNSEIAAYQNDSNVYDKKPNTLVITVANTPGDGDSGGGQTRGDSCVSKKADLVTLEADGKTVKTRTALTPSSNVKVGDIIEYKILVKETNSDSASATIKDKIPANVEYITGSMILDALPTNDNPEIATDRLINKKIGFGITSTRRPSRTLTYKVRVKSKPSPSASFTNAAEVFINDDSASPSVCSIPLSVSDTTTPPVTNAPKLNLAFKVQGVTKAGITKEAEVTLRYKHKTTGEIITKPPFTISFTSAEASTSESTPVGAFRSPAFELTDLNLDEVDKSTTQYPTFGTGIEVFVKTPTSLRKKLGELTYERSQAPVVIKGLYATDDKKLLIGDYDRSAPNQVNVIRSSDLGKLLAQFTDLSHPVTAQNREYDIDNNGTLNSTDISLLLGNLTDISIKGDEL